MSPRSPLPGWFVWSERVAWVVALMLGVLSLGLGAQVLGHGPFLWESWLLPLVGGELGGLDEATLVRYQARTQPLQTRQAVDVASARLWSALEPPPSSAEGIARLVGALREDGAFERAEAGLVEARRQLGPAPALDAEEVWLLLAMNRPAEARQAGWRAVERHGIDGGAGLVRAALRETFRRDRVFDDGRSLTLQAGRDLQALALSPRFGEVLEAATPTGEVAIFMPERPGRPYGHLAPLIGLRLCLLLGCATHLPDARLAQLEPGNLSFLMKQSGAAPLEVVTREERDGSWVSGSWVRLHASGRGAGLLLGEPALLARLLGGVEAPESSPGSGARVVAEVGGSSEASAALGERSAAWLAGQVSDAWVLAFLLQAAPGGAEPARITPLGLQPSFVFEALPASPEGAPAGDLEPLRRLRPETARGLRTLDPADATGWLFPGAGEDPARAAVAAAFWRRHGALLRHLEGLEAQHGADALLPVVAEK